MREEHGHRGRAFRQLREIGWPLGPEPDADQIDNLVVDREAGPRVFQHLHAVSDERGRHVVIVVVVAEDREHPILRGQRRERIG